MKLENCDIDEVVMVDISHGAGGGDLTATFLLLKRGAPVCQCTRPIPFDSKVQNAWKTLTEVIESAIADELGTTQSSVPTTRRPRGIMDDI